MNYGQGYANLHSKVFFIWFDCRFLWITFVCFMIYETKGLTLEQVDELYTEASSARKSVGWKPTITFCEMRQASVEIQNNVDEDKTDGKEASHAME